MLIFDRKLKLFDSYFEFRLKFEILIMSWIIFHLVAVYFP